MEKTADIFDLVVADTLTDERYGVSAGTLVKLAGGGEQHAETEDEFVAEVILQAKNFAVVVKGLIDDDETNQSDLKMLDQMLGWTFDAAAIEKMARADWREYHPT